MIRYVSIVAILVVGVACAASFLHSAKWIGHFTLTVDLDIAPTVDASSIAYVEAWDRDVATWLCNDPPNFAAGFEPPAKSTTDSHYVAVTCSGESGAFGLFDTYRQPQFLVVQYRTLDAPDDTLARKIHKIPAGRGSRRTTLTLP